MAWFCPRSVWCCSAVGVLVGLAVVLTAEPGVVDSALAQALTGPKPEKTKAHRLVAQVEDIMKEMNENAKAINEQVKADAPNWKLVRHKSAIASELAFLASFGSPEADFDQWAMTLSSTMADLNTAAVAQDAAKAKATFQAATKVCAQCHQKYRKDEE